MIVLSLVACFLLLLWLFTVVGHFIFLLMLAWLFSVAMEPAIRRIVARGRSRGLATAIVGGLVILIALILVVVFGELLVQQIDGMINGLPGLVTSAVNWVNQTFHTNYNPSALTSGLDPRSGGSLSGVMGTLSGGMLGVLGSGASVMMDLVTVLVFGFYMAAAGPKLLKAIATGMRPSAQRVFVTTAQITAEKTGGYVASKIILAALSTVFHGILFAAIGVPNWLPYALLVGITAQFVPLIGTYIGVILPVLATIFDAPWKAVVIVVFALVYQQIESYVFTPRVSQKTMDVNPAIALAAVFVGVAIWGPIGAIIGIPLAAAGFAIADTYSSRYELIPELAEDTTAS